MTPLLVCRFERFGHLPRDGQGIADSNRSARDDVRQRVAFHQFEDDAGQAVSLLQTVDRGDVGVIERGEQLASRWKRARRSGSSANDRAAP